MAAEKVSFLLNHYANELHLRHISTAILAATIRVQVVMVTLVPRSGHV